jgi:aryl-alcohol dehydrogenase-like predicted oxidoreductase
VSRVQPSQLTRSGPFFEHFNDQRRVDAVEELMRVAEEGGLSLTHMAIAFVLAHPGVTAAITDPRTLEQLEDLLAGAEVTLTDDLLDRIDAVVSPGADIGRHQMIDSPPTLTTPALRRRPTVSRAVG